MCEVMDMRIAIMGYVGSGKSVLARELAKHLSIPKLWVLNR